MNAVFDIIAKILSLVFYPLFVPTYGIALFCYAWSVQSLQPIPLVWSVLAVSGTLVFTCVLVAASRFVSNRKQRRFVKGRK